jgi:hypothetical protein
MLIAPAGAAFAGGASVALGTAVGELVLPLEDGAFVAAGAAPLSAGTGVAVADDPQANNSATNNSTTAFVRCLETRALTAVCGTNVLPRYEMLLTLNAFR